MVGSLEDALALARKFAAEGGVDAICVIGGGQIFVQAMPLADRLHLTRVLSVIEGDTYFPEINPQDWQLLSSEDVPAGDKDSYPTRYMLYERRVS